MAADIDPLKRLAYPNFIFESYDEARGAALLTAIPLVGYIAGQMVCSQLNSSISYHLHQINQVEGGQQGEANLKQNLIANLEARTFFYALHSLRHALETIILCCALPVIDALGIVLIGVEIFLCGYFAAKASRSTYITREIETIGIRPKMGIVQNPVWL
jgi:hypothetical protein